MPPDVDEDIQPAGREAPAAGGEGAADAVEVALPTPVRRTFHYAVPEPLRGEVRIGMRVRVPFGGRRRMVGVCVGHVSRDAAARTSLKEIEKVLDAEPSVTPALLELTRFVADYYRCSWGEALEAALPGSVKRRVRKKGAAGLEGSAGAGSRAATEGAHAAPELALTEGQRGALEAVLECVRARRFGVTLVHGVTGSGKTEVYLRAIAETVRLGRAAILLVPEISLTPQTVARIRDRLGDVGILHSMQGDAERARQWERIRRGEVRIVVGPRSAVFAPVTDLGLIVVDEEHDGSFKQETVPRYQARDVAIVRAKIEKAAAVLGSATPSLESYVNAKEGRYRGVYLSERATRARLPDVELVDMRDETRSVKGFPFLSRRLEQALSAALARGEQAILFLNRRGFATFLRCRSCNEVLTCGSCDVALTFHKAEGVALCHYCEATRPPPKECPKCLSHDLQYFGFGTERVEEEVCRRVPKARVRRVDSDAIEDGSELEEVLGAFGRGEVDVLIGTQMVSKGLDFARVTLVGVILADTALNLPDFRAAERTFQLVTQVAGRSGRAALGGISIVQTFSPDHPAIVAARTHDSIGFLEGEIGHRRALGYPPFSKLARLVVTGPDERETAHAAENVAAWVRGKLAEAGTEGGVKLLGPSPAPISVLRGKHRFMVLLKAKDRAALRAALDALETAPRLPGSARLLVDVDPVSML